MEQSNGPREVFSVPMVKQISHAILFLISPSRPKIAACAIHAREGDVFCFPWERKNGGEILRLKNIEDIFFRTFDRASRGCKECASK